MMIGMSEMDETGKDTTTLMATEQTPVEELRQQWTLILEKLIVEDRDFTVSFLVGDATDEEIPSPVRHLRPEILTINFWHDGSIGSMEVKDGLLCFTAPFYSTLGSDYYCAIKLERIMQIKVFPAKPSAEDRRDKDRKGLRSV